MTFIKRAILAAITLVMLYVVIFYVMPGLILLAIVGSLMLL